MKIVFVGTVQIGLTVLEAVYQAGYTVDTVVTLPLEMKVSTSGFVDFAPLAEKHKSKLVRTNDINEKDTGEHLLQVKPDIIIVCGWQQLLSAAILKIPKIGSIGFHSSLLPKYRGRAPVNWAIIMGEKETGITMFYLTPEADTGDIIAQKSFPILFSDDCNTVYEKSAKAGAQLIKEFLPKIERNEVARIHNDSASYPLYPKRRPEDGRIDFNRPAVDVYNFVRALTRPYPGAFYFNERGNKVIVWKIEIIFDESRIKNEDIVFSAKDFKVKLLDWQEVGQAR